MEPITMVDLKGQYKKIRTQIEKEFEKIFESTSFINGPVVDEFAQDLSHYNGSKHVIPCANGTDALQIALMSLDLKPGDEVITSPFTFIATAEVINLLKLKAVFIDIDPDTFNIDAEKIEAAITKNTKVIIPVHLYGQCADMEVIMEIAAKYNLAVIEDNAQAIGAEYHFSNGSIKKSGSIGTIGCTSFFPSKNLGAYGDGGAIFTEDDDLAESLSVIVNHGMKKRYYHDVVGVNSRLDSLQAAVLKVKLSYLDDYIRARQNAANYYSRKLSSFNDLQTPVEALFTSHVYHQYTIKVLNGQRDQLHEYLLRNKIPNAIYYPVPLHLQKAFAYCGYEKGDFPVAEKLSEQVLSLPMHTELDEEQLGYICSNILNFF